MFLFRILLCAVGVGITAMSAASAATVITFDDVPEQEDNTPCSWQSSDEQSYEEGGYTFGNCPGYEGGTPGIVFLEDAGSDTPKYMTVTQSDGSTFSAISMDVITTTGDYGYYADSGEWYYLTYDNIVATGYLDGVLVATQYFSSMDTSSYSDEITLLFSDAFSDIDELVITALRDTESDSTPIDGVTCIDAPCMDVKITSLTLGAAVAASPVPLPSGLPLLSGGFLALIALGWRRWS